MEGVEGSKDKGVGWGGKGKIMGDRWFACASHIHSLRHMEAMRSPEG